MNKQVVIVCVALVLLLSACSGMGVPFNTIQGSGVLASEGRTVDGIRGVTLATLGDLTITLGEKESLQIEAEDNLLPNIEAKVENGMLTIQQKKGVNIQPTKPVRYTLTVISLEAIAATSAGNIMAPELQAGDFKATISSSGNITLAGIQAENLEVQINSAGSLEIGEGKVQHQQITINSSGSYTAENLNSQTARIAITSSGNATVWVKERIDTTLDSSGSVYYFGNPLVAEQNTSSGRTESMGRK